MKPEVLEALKGSIRKWESIVAGIGIDAGTHNCDLCKMFRIDDCRYCPSECGMNSAYSAWETHQVVDHDRCMVNNHFAVFCPECRRLAQAELRPPEIFTAGRMI